MPPKKKAIISSFNTLTKDGYDISVPNTITIGSAEADSFVDDQVKFLKKEGAVKLSDFLASNALDDDYERLPLSEFPEATDQNIRTQDRFEVLESGYDHTNIDDHRKEQVNKFTNYLQTLIGQNFIPYISKEQQDIALLKNSEVTNIIKTQSSWNPISRTYEFPLMTKGAGGVIKLPSGKTTNNKRFLGIVGNRKNQFLYPEDATGKLTYPTGRHFVKSQATAHPEEIVSGTKSMNSKDDALQKAVAKQVTQAAKGGAVTQQSLEISELRNFLGRNSSTGQNIPFSSIHQTPHRKLLKSALLSIYGVKSGVGGATVSVNPTRNKGDYLNQFGHASQGISREIAPYASAMRGGYSGLKDAWNELISDVNAAGGNPNYVLQDSDYPENYKLHAPIITNSAGDSVYSVPIGNTGQTIEYSVGNNRTITQDKGPFDKALYLHKVAGYSSPLNDTTAVNEYSNYISKVLSGVSSSPAPIPAPVPVPAPAPVYNPDEIVDKPVIRLKRKTQPTAGSTLVQSMISTRPVIRLRRR